MTELQIIRASEQAQKTDIPEYPPLSEKQLDDSERVGRYGLVTHTMVGDDPPPVHMHPSTWLALVQEVRRARREQPSAVTDLVAALRGMTQAYTNSHLLSGDGYNDAEIERAQAYADEMACAALAAFDEVGQE
jgi:hypothetical protein